MSARLIMVLAALLASAAHGEVCPPFELRQMAGPLGLDFVHRSGASAERHLPESMGSGMAWLDFDGDGWLDLYLVQSGEFPPIGSSQAANRLFRSLDGRGFEDVTARSGAGDLGYGQGVVAGDVDGDGDADLVVTNFGLDALLTNRGDGTFDRRPLPGSEGWSSSAALADIDRDGDLDLYVTTYVVYDLAQVPVCPEAGGVGNRYCDPSLFRGAADRLYLNDGAGGFSDASERLPVTAVSGRGLGVVMVDLDGDLAPEIYVANDLTPNALLANDGQGGFADLSLVSGAAVNREGRSEAGMGVAVADIDGDLDPDLAVTNFDVETNTLYENLGGWTFRDISAASGFGPPSLNELGFGLLALDLELDGDLDFWIANGHIFERPNRDNTSYAQPSQLLLADGGRWRAVTCDGPWREPLVARGAASADFDNDGDRDLALQQSNGPLRMVVNEAKGLEFLGVDLSSRAGGEAVGAVGTLNANGRGQRAWVLAGDSYQSTSDRRLLFARPSGQGPAVLDVVWPSGARTRLPAPPGGRYLRMAEPRRR